MDRRHDRTRRYRRRPEEADYTATWLTALLLFIATLMVAVLLDDSIAFPVG